MVVTAVAGTGAHVGALSCSLLQQKGIGAVADIKARWALPRCSRERQVRAAQVSAGPLRPIRRMCTTRLRAGAETEHLGVLNVPSKPAAAAAAEPQVISLPQSAPSNHDSISSPEDSAAQPSAEESLREAAELRMEERIANGAHAGPSGQEDASGAPSDSPGRSQTVTEASPDAPSSNESPSGASRRSRTPSDVPSDGEGEPMYGSRTLREVCDKLIAVFTVEKPEVVDWKRLLALSSEWANIRPKFYTHVKRRAKEAEDEGNPEYALQLYSLQRRLNKVVTAYTDLKLAARNIFRYGPTEMLVEDEMAGHDKLLAEVEAETDWNSMVVRRREKFTQDFFQHIRIRADSQFNELGRRDELVNLSAKLVTAVQMHDNIQKDESLMLKAEEKFLSLLDSPDLTTLDSKIDQLAQTGGLDPALLLTMSKAYCAAKDTDLVRDEVKDIMAHMYFKAQASQQMYLPKEVRILRYLITIDDPQERYRALEQAFDPGDESDPFEDADTALLYTTPEKLYDLISNVLKAYFTGAKASTMLKEAAALMRPKVIDRIKLLRDMIQKDFM